jgi:hypothetical protein
MKSWMNSLLRGSLTGLCLLLALNQVRASDGWLLLKLGMTGSEVTAALGNPLICSKGRGFERWTYDNGAEVLIHGLLIGWTSPGVADVVNRSTDIWQAGSADTPSAVIISPQPFPATHSLATAVGGGAASPSRNVAAPRGPSPRGAASRW